MAFSGVIRRILTADPRYMPKKPSDRKVLRKQSNILAYILSPPGPIYVFSKKFVNRHSEKCSTIISSYRLVLQAGLDQVQGKHASDSNHTRNASIDDFGKQSKLLGLLVRGGYGARDGRGHGDNT